MLKNFLLCFLVCVMLIITGCATNEEKFSDNIVDVAIKIEQAKDNVETIVDTVDTVKDAVVENIVPEKTFSDKGLTLVAPGTWLVVEDVNTELFIKNDEVEDKFVQVTCVNGVQNMLSDMVEFISQAHALYVDGKYTSEEIINYYRQQYPRESLELLRPFWEKGFATRADLEEVFCKGQAIKTPLTGEISFNEYKTVNVNIMGEQEYCFIGTYYDESVRNTLTMFKTVILSGDINYCILAVGISDMVDENEIVTIIESFTSTDLQNATPSQEILTFDRYLMTEADYITAYIDYLEADGWAWAVYDMDGRCDLWQFEKSEIEPWKGYIAINDEYAGDFYIESADEQIANGYFYPASGDNQYALSVYFENDMPVVTIGEDVYVLE